MTDVQGTVELTATVMSQREYMLLLTVLRNQIGPDEMSEEAFAALAILLAGQDLLAQHWIFDPGNSSWAHIDSEPWSEGKPHGPLMVMLPSEVLADLDAMFETVRGAEDAARARLEGSTTQADIAPSSGDAGARALAYCPSCGAHLRPEQRFCTHCGQSLAEYWETA